MNKSTFDVQEDELKNLLFQHKNFRIPRFQRPYSWSKDQIEDFWNDIKDRNENDSDLFFGTFIFNSETLEEDGYYEVVDGQQRLVTITIFMAVLRDLAFAHNLKIKNKDLATAIQNSTITLESRYEGQDTYRLKGSDTISSFLENYIQDFDETISVPDAKDKTREQKLVKDNYIYFYDELSSLLKDKKVNDKAHIISQLASRVDSLRAIAIIIGSEEDAYVIFETVNARGTELSVADLLKNLIFKNIRPAGGKDDPKQDWQKIVDNLREADDQPLSKFIRHYWLSKYKFVSEKKLYRDIKSTIDKNWEVFLEELHKSSYFYKMIFSGSEEDFKEIDSKNFIKVYFPIFAIRIMKSRQAATLLISLLTHYNSKTGSHIIRMLDALECFTFRYFYIGNNPGNRVERLYSKYSIKINNDLKTQDKKNITKNMDRLASNFIKELKDLLPIEEDFQSDFLKLKYKDSEKSRQMLKYILSKIDRYVSNTPEYRINFDNVNIEHVLPKKPILDELKDDDDYKDYVDSLGNLTLLYDKFNSSAGNKILEDKIPILKKSNIRLNQDLLKNLSKNNNIWDKKHIEHRHERFAKLANEKVWFL